MPPLILNIWDNLAGNRERLRFIGQQAIIIVGNLGRPSCNQADAHGIHGSFGARSGPNLGKDVAQVYLNSIGTDIQPLCDLFIAGPSCNQAQDLQLALA